MKAKTSVKLALNMRLKRRKSIFSPITPSMNCGPTVKDFTDIVVTPRGMKKLAKCSEGGTEDHSIQFLQELLTLEDRVAEALPKYSQMRSKGIGSVAVTQYLATKQADADVKKSMNGNDTFLQLLVLPADLEEDYVNFFETFIAESGDKRVDVEEKTVEEVKSMIEGRSDDAPLPVDLFFKASNEVLRYLYRTTYQRLFAMSSPDVAALCSPACSPPSSPRPRIRRLSSASSPVVGKWGGPIPPRRTAAAK